MARRSGGLIVAVLQAIGGVIVGILVIHILLVLFDANPANAFATFIANAANFLAFGLGNLFVMTNGKVMVLVNYGLAAIIWLLIIGLLTRLARRA